MILNNSYKIKPFRIELSEKYITRFDDIDRKPLHQIPWILPLNKITVQEYSTLKIPNLYSIIWLEFLGAQRLLFWNSLNNKKSSFFVPKLTIRKKKLFLILEICLNSLFLNYITNLNCMRNQNLHFFFNLKVLNNLNFSLKSSSVSFLISFSQKDQSTIDYLIPNSSRGE